MHVLNIQRNCIPSHMANQLEKLALEQRKAGYLNNKNIQPYIKPDVVKNRELTLSNSEHLCAACRANTLCCWLTIFHGYAFSILHLLLSSTLNTICLHENSPPFFLNAVYMNDKPSP